MEKIDNNSEQLIKGIATIFNDIDDLPEGEIKNAIKEIKKIDKKIDEKNK